MIGPAGASGAAMTLPPGGKISPGVTLLTVIGCPLGRPSFDGLSGDAFEDGQVDGERDAGEALIFGAHVADIAAWP